MKWVLTLSVYTVDMDYDYSISQRKKIPIKP
jgi:hypothetical protein